MDKLAREIERFGIALGEDVENVAGNLVVVNDATVGDDLRVEDTIGIRGETSVTIESKNARLAIVGDPSAAFWAVDAVAHSADALGYGTAIAKSRNVTPGSHTVVQDGDVCREDWAYGSDGTDFEPLGYARWEVDGTPGNDDMPGRYIVSVTLDGMAAPTDRLFVFNSGLMELRTSAFGSGFNLYHNAVHGDNVDINTLSFYGQSDSGAKTLYGKIVGRAVSDANGAHSAALRLYSATGGADIEALRLIGSEVVVKPDVATPAAGSTSARLLFGTTTGFGIYYGSGAPTVSAGQGSYYMRSDGTTTNNRAYLNTDGGTTWTAVITAA